MPRPLPPDVRAALTDGDTLEAIRLLRQQTGLGLVAAKAAIDSGLVPDARPAGDRLALSPPEARRPRLTVGRALAAIILAGAVAWVALGAF